MKGNLGREKGFTIVLLTIIMMLLVSIVVFSLMFLSYFEYQSNLNYSRYEQAYYLAFGAQEEAMSRLSSNWNTTSETSWISLEDGEYCYEIIALSPIKKKIISQGKASTIIRKFESIVQIPSPKVDLEYFTNYSLYCDGDLTVKDLAGITLVSSVDIGTLGVTGNLIINSITGGSYPIDVKGNTIVTRASKNAYIKMYPQVDSNLPLCSTVEYSAYIDWLQGEYTDRMHSINLDYDQDFILEESTNPTTLGVWDICLVKDVHTLIVKDLNFDGLLILDNVEHIQVVNSTIIKGMVLVLGSKTESLSFEGNFRGNISFINTKSISYFSGKLVYDKEVIQHITPFLSKELVSNNGITHLTRIKWNEIE